MMLSQYAIKIFSIVLLTSLADLILPQGKLKSSAKVVFSLAVVAVLVSPIISLISGAREFEFTFAEAVVDEKVIDFSDDLRADYYENQAESLLKESGIELAEVDILFSEDKRKVNSVVINLQNSVITSPQEHINKSVVAKKAIAELFGISKEAVLCIE